ncbi:hypothetical protein OESDEN_21622 [Oesophagostomum dentatum]|uniref:Uncharacterized protein n=1 Tax=Oesophagostomum dentatum TaxID=61180 RepID=A0A0B1S6C3_OESDE|nr:hypothetical protein OESDEN_21622 [Oesophagostomum dentatum]
MKTFCLAGSMALVLICQFFLLRYIILKSRESEADVESAAAGNTPRKADVRKKNNIPFFDIKNKTGTEENKKVENEKPKEQRGSNEPLDVVPSPVAKASPENAPPNKPAAAVIPIPINEPVAAQHVFNAPPAPAPAPSPIRSGQGKPELQPKSMLKKNFDPAKSSYGWDWM